MRPEPQTLQEMQARIREVNARLGLGPTRPIVRRPIIVPQEVLETHRDEPAQPTPPVVAPVAAIAIAALPSLPPVQQDADPLWRLRDLLTFCAVAGGVTTNALRSEDRTFSTVRPRQIFCWLGRQFTARSLPDIGHMIERDHTTTLHAVRRVDDVIRQRNLHAPHTPLGWTAALLAALPWPTWADKTEGVS